MTIEKAKKAIAEELEYTKTYPNDPKTKEWVKGVTYGLKFAMDLLNDIDLPYQGGEE